MKRLVVLALNPSIDAEWRVDGVRWEEKNNVLSERRWAGGKGINVARWLKHLGTPAQLILPLGGASGRELTRLLRAEKLPATVVQLGRPLTPSLSPSDGETSVAWEAAEGIREVEGPQGRASGGERVTVAEGRERDSRDRSTRVNVIVSTKAQGQLRFNPPGPELSKSEWQMILQTVEHSISRWSERPREPFVDPLSIHPRLARTLAPPRGVLILSGSLPPGLPANAYAQLIRLARARKVPVLLDCDGPALAAAAGARPFLVKPNEHELLGWLRQARIRPRSVKAMPALSLPGVEAEVGVAARQLSAVTGGWVFVSRGARPALLINTTLKIALTARPPRVKPRNTVGAGDALLAGVARAVAAGLPPEAWLSAGLAAGSAATRLPAGKLPA